MSVILIGMGIIPRERREVRLRRIANVGKWKRGFMAINLINDYKILLGNGDGEGRVRVCGRQQWQWW
jgi:hypothetical protein